MSHEIVEFENKNPAVQRLNMLGSLVPARVIRHYLARPGQTQLVPFSEEYDGAVLFADISGFSALAEKLAKEVRCAANAAENLSSYIGKSLELMVHAVCSKGGDVIKFAGDAILAIFPTAHFQNSLEEATLTCTKVALSLLELELRAGGVELSVHCGVGAGKVTCYHVGGLHDRWEYVITGDPVDQIGSAEPEANAGEVVIAKAAHALIEKYCQGINTESGNFRVDDISDKKIIADHELVFSEFLPLIENNTELVRMLQVLRSYVPRPVLQAIDSGQSLWFSELRLCSTLFCKIKGLQFNATESLDLIQQAVMTVQEQIYTYEGTLCRFIVDDKGAGLLLAFGLPPYMHENDPVRATKSAMEIHRSMQTIKNAEGIPLSCSIGVTSGRVFCGTTGGRIRCEYTLHGTLVNLAARYMVAAKDGVLCGEVTYKESKQYITFTEPVSLKVKGKKEAVNVYRPIEAKDMQSFDASSSKVPIVGRKLECQMIDQTFQGLLSRQSFNKVILISGDAGIGKSRLMQHAFKRAQRAKLNVLLGIGVDTEMSTPLFVFKSILTQLVPMYYKRVVRFRFRAWLQSKGQRKAQASSPSAVSGPNSPGTAATVSSPHGLVSATTTTGSLQSPGSPLSPESPSSPASPPGFAVNTITKTWSTASNQSASPTYSIQNSTQLDQIILSDDLGEEFFQSIDSLVDSKDKVRMDESSEQLLRYMGFTDAPIEDLVVNHSYDPPPFDKLSKQQTFKILADLIPSNKGNLKEMYPLLCSIIPKLVEIKDNETTGNMKKELRAENLLLLVKEIFISFVQKLEVIREHSVKMQLNQKRMSKAMSTLGIEEQKPNQKSKQSASNSRYPSAGLDGPNSKLSEISIQSAHLNQVNEGKELSDGVHLQLGKGPNEMSYRMRVRGGQNTEQQGDQYQDRVVLLIEDIQWMDPASIRLIRQLTEEVSPMVALFSTRHSENSGFDMNEIVHMRLGNLSHEEVREGMCMWLGVKEIPDKALQAVMEKSGGHPLFSAELSKLMEAEKMIIIENDTCKLSKKAQEGAFGLPDTISALMTSKLDRLPPSQQLALKVAAVIGIEFQKNELIALMPPTDDNDDDEHKGLSNDISMLVEAGLLSRDANMMYHYRFTNALLRESAYNLLLFQKRKDLHRKLAEFHEERNKEYLEPVYFLLATNYYLSEVNEKAVLYSEMAGNDALDVHGMQQVLICFSRLIELDSKDPQVTKHIPLVRKVGWNRKVGEALHYLGKSRDAEEYFHAALEQMNFHRSSGVIEPSGCLSFLKKGRQPHLVKTTAAFQEMVKNKDVELILEAASAYEFLGKINNDRGSVEALEYRLNALDLARAADRHTRELDADVKLSIPRDELLDMVSAELARSYAYAAVFFICIGSAEMEDMGRDHIKTASLLVDSVKDSETQALVHFKASEFAAMVGELKLASDGVRKALWVCQFLNYERLNIECQELSVTISTFLGNFGKAKRSLQQAVERMPFASPNYLILALAARIALFVGDFDFAESTLERIGRLEKGTFDRDFHTAYKKLIQSEMPETLLALSLLLVRKYGKNELAIAAAIRGTELLHSSDLSDLPLVSFHTAAFLFTAFAESLGGTSLKKKRNRDSSRRSHRLSFSQVVPYDEATTTQTSRQIRKNARRYLKQVLVLLKKYAKVYKPCQPHVTYCMALYKKILNGQTDVKTFLLAANQAESAGTQYIRALSLFEAALVDRRYINDAKLAFCDCSEGKQKHRLESLTLDNLNPDMPFDIRMLFDQTL